MSWNYRVMAHQYKDEVYFQLHSVYYIDNKPDSYSATPTTISSETLEGVKWDLNRMQEAIKKPVLWAGDKFPNECKVKYTCNLCGRNGFDSPSPHNCKGGFRKRKLSWSIKYE